MLNKKTLGLALLSLICWIGFASVTQAADNTKAKATKSALTLTIAAPDALSGLGPNEKPDPVYLQFTGNDGSPPLYSGPVYPGDSKSSVELKITSISSNGGQIQFVSNTSGNIQPMSFIFAFTGERLTCLINKNAKIKVDYNINNKLLNVNNLPAGC